MSGKNVTTTKRVQKKEAIKYATAGINAFKVYINNLPFLKRVKAAALIVIKRYK